MLDSIWLKANSSLVRLPDGSEIYQHKEGQKVSSDNEIFNKLLIKRFKSLKDQKLKVLELGLGNGINAIMLKKIFPHWEITGIEIDSEQALLAQYNCKIQNLDVKIINGDLRDFKFDNSFDIIIANPPYIEVGKGRLSPSKRRNIAKFEISCKMQDILEALVKNLKVNGLAYLLYSANRKDDLSFYFTDERFDLLEQIETNKIIISGLKYVTD